MSIYTKLFDLQQKVEAIKKDSENPHFRSKYFDINGIIAALKPHLKEIGLVVFQPVHIVEGQNILKTIVADKETTETIESEIVLPPCGKPQEFGSALTYFRRYSLQSLLLLEAEDDDGNAASATSQPVAPKPKTYTSKPVAPKKPEETKPYSSENPF